MCDLQAVPFWHRILSISALTVDCLVRGLLINSEACRLVIVERRKKLMIDEGKKQKKYKGEMKIV